MQADIQAKNAARQALVDDLEARKPTKTPDTPAPVSEAPSRAGIKGSMSGSGTPGAATPGLRDLEVDEMDADGEDDEGSYAATPAARTAAEGETPRYASGDDADAYGDDDDDDLFGDADADGEEDGGGGGEAGDLSGLAAQAVSGSGAEQSANTPGAGAGEDEDGGDDADGEEDEDDPMAAMLREELGEMAAAPGTPMDQDARDDASRDILDQFAAASADAQGTGSPYPAAHASSPAMDYSAVEGGVGMRRLAEGVAPDDDEEESSDDSSDDD